MTKGFGDEYFKNSSKTTSNDDKEVLLDNLKNLINSRNNIDSLLNFAKWEPRHGRFKKDHPWSQYQKIGELAQVCASRAETLHPFIYNEVQASKEVKAKFKEPCTKMSTQSGKNLCELSMAITKMTHPSKAKPHIQNAKQGVQNLHLLLTSNIWKNNNISDVTSTATIAYLLADIIDCTEEIFEAVEELASMAKFKKVSKNGKVAPEIERTKLANQGSIKRRSIANHVIIIDGSSPVSSPKKNVTDEPLNDDERQNMVIINQVLN